MKFYSTKNRTLSATLKEAVLNNMPTDGGLYMPQEIPTLSSALVEDLPSLAFAESAFRILQELLTDSIPAEVLREICLKAFIFDASLVTLSESIHTLELFHGPTLAFKDFGVRFMAELLTYYRDKKRLTILTATSGDTGGAVASAFHRREGFEVFILYPKGKVSPIQEHQIAGLGDNIIAIEVDGTFDDCQRLVKQTLADPHISSKRSFCSANSINVSRLLPQTCYYFRAYAQLKNPQNVIFSVPSGNFGNLAACLMAKKMGLPIKLAVAATNSNDIVPRYISSGRYEVHPFKETLSNAMDIADPSNFVRVLSLYDQSLESLKRDLIAQSFTDEETKDAILELYQKYTYISEPHGAIGYMGLSTGLKRFSDAQGIFLGTAHPVKFKETVEPIVNATISEPTDTKTLTHMEKSRLSMSPDFQALLNILSK